MKILYFINCSGNGSGGHYHSLDQVSNELGKVNEVHVISLGLNPSPVISNNKAFIKHIYFKSIYDFFSASKEVKKALNDINPDILHFFDNESLNTVLLILRKIKIPVVLNKCGGPNPKREKWQFTDALVLFSYENYNWFFNNKNYNPDNIFLIPNRVQKLNLLPEDKRKEEKSKVYKTFMRVTRLGGAYEKTLLDTFNLIKELSPKFKVKLLVVGKIQDKERFEYLKSVGKSFNINVEYITDERASRGADFLYLADFVIGTGRSMMEAMSLGIPCLAPAQNADMPILINPSNFKSFFDANFSERAIADKNSLDTNSYEVENALSDLNFYDKLRQNTEMLFENELSSKHIVKKYTAVYEKVSKSRKFGNSLLSKNLNYVILFIIKHLKKRK